MVNTLVTLAIRRIPMTDIELRKAVAACARHVERNTPEAALPLVVATLGVIVEEFLSLRKTVTKTYFSDPS